MTGTAPQSITCVDCGEEARLLAVSDPDEQGERIASYRCTGCLDRWDLVVDGEGPPPAGPGAPLGGTGPASS